MRINNQLIAGIAKAYQKQNREDGVSQTSGSAQQDQLKISHEAKFFNVAKVALQQLPESDEQKLAELSASIKQGTYEVKSEELVEKIWQENFFDQII